VKVAFINGNCSSLYETSFIWECGDRPTRQPYKLQLSIDVIVRVTKEETQMGSRKIGGMDKSCVRRKKSMSRGIGGYGYVFRAPGRGEGGS
jgi:hypothetical protein